MNPQTLKLCIQNNIDIPFLLVLPAIQKTNFKSSKLQKMCIFEANLLIVYVFVKILLYNLTLKKFVVDKKLCKGVLKL